MECCPTVHKSHVHAVDFPWYLVLRSHQVVWNDRYTYTGDTMTFTQLPQDSIGPCSTFVLKTFPLGIFPKRSITTLSHLASKSYPHILSFSLFLIFRSIFTLHLFIYTNRFKIPFKRISKYLWYVSTQMQI